MKKITIMLACISAISLSSCKKDRTCTCTDTDNNGKTTTQTYTLVDATGRDAKDACTNSSYQSTQGSTTSKNSTECTLD